MLKEFFISSFISSLGSSVNDPESYLLRIDYHFFWSLMSSSSRASVPRMCVSVTGFAFNTARLGTQRNIISKTNLLGMITRNTRRQGKWQDNTKLKSSWRSTSLECQKSIVTTSHNIYCSIHNRRINQFS